MNFAAIVVIYRAEMQRAINTVFQLAGYFYRSLFCGLWFGHWLANTDN